MPKKPNASDAKPPEVVRITKLDQLSALFAKPIPARFELRGQLIEVEVRALTPKEEGERNAILREPQPKVIKGKTQSEDRIEYNDPAFVTAKERAEKKARAYCIYRACPVVHEAKSGLTSADEICDFVQGLWNDHVLEIIYLTIFTGGVSVADRANFTTAPDSAQN